MLLFSAVLQCSLASLLLKCYLWSHFVSHKVILFLTPIEIKRLSSLSLWTTCTLWASVWKAFTVLFFLYNKLKPIHFCIRDTACQICLIWWKGQADPQWVAHVSLSDTLLAVNSIMLWLLIYITLLLVLDGQITERTNIMCCVSFSRWVFIYEKGYQSTDTAVSSVFTKMKGVGYTNVSGRETVWDVADYVFPSQVSVWSPGWFIQQLPVPDFFNCTRVSFKPGLSQEALFGQSLRIGSQHLHFMNQAVTLMKISLIQTANVKTIYS